MQRVFAVEKHWWRHWRLGGLTVPVKSIDHFELRAQIFLVEVRQHPRIDQAFHESGTILRESQRGQPVIAHPLVIHLTECQSLCAWGKGIMIQSNDRLRKSRCCKLVHGLFSVPCDWWVAPKGWSSWPSPGWLSVVSCGAGSCRCQSPAESPFRWVRPWWRRSSRWHGTPPRTMPACPPTTAITRKNTLTLSPSLCVPPVKDEKFFRYTRRRIC